MVTFSKGWCDMIKDWTDAAWAISNISALAGEFTASASEGRHLSWASDKDYWMHLIICDAGKPRVLIYEWFAPANKMWGVIGYCKYNDIHLEIDGNMYEDDNNEEK